MLLNVSLTLLPQMVIALLVKSPSAFLDDCFRVCLFEGIAESITICFYRIRGIERGLIECF